MVTTAAKLSSKWKSEENSNTKPMDMAAVLGRMNMLMDQEAAINTLRMQPAYIEGLIDIVDIRTDRAPQLSKEDMIKCHGDYDIVRANAIMELGKYLEKAPANHDDMVMRVVGVIRKVHLEDPVETELKRDTLFYNSCAKQMAKYIISTIDSGEIGWVYDVNQILRR